MLQRHVYLAHLVKKPSCILTKVDRLIIRAGMGSSHFLRASPSRGGGSKVCIAGALGYNWLRKVSHFEAP